MLWGDNLWLKSANLHDPYNYYITGFMETVPNCTLEVTRQLIGFKDLKALKPAKDFEHADKSYTDGGPFHCA